MLVNDINLIVDYIKKCWKHNVEVNVNYKSQDQKDDAMFVDIMILFENGEEAYEIIDTWGSIVTDVYHAFGKERLEALNVYFSFRVPIPNRLYY